MKKLFSLFVFSISLLFNTQANAQVPGSDNTAPTDQEYYQQGYTLGCQLKKVNNQTLYESTSSNSNFPSSYRNGVNEGWAACSAQSLNGNDEYPDPDGTITYSSVWHVYIYIFSGGGVLIGIP